MANADRDTRLRRGAATVLDDAKRVVGIVGPALQDRAEQNWCFGLNTVPEERRALGLVAMMAADLILGAGLMFEAQHYYSGESLVRQLIETDYLRFLFGNDAQEAVRWLNGTTAEHKSMFQPASMRKRVAGRFDVDEYSRHCEVGGHPRPAGRSLVGRHFSAPHYDGAVLWADFANHAVRVWDNYKPAVARCAPTNVYPDRWAAIDAGCADWWQCSAALQRLIRGDTTAEGHPPQAPSR